MPTRGLLLKAGIEGGKSGHVGCRAIECSPMEIVISTLYRVQVWSIIAMQPCVVMGRCKI